MEPGTNDADKPSVSPIEQIPKKSSRRPAIIVAVVGVVLLAFIAATGIFFARQTADERAVLSEAAKGCDVLETEGVSIGDGGLTISFDTLGTEDSYGATIDDVACVLFAVQTPDAVVSRIDATRALDGTQTANWGSIAASWGYHPDTGLQLVLTTTGTQ
jgi:hypothetical protein